jgi:signal transduction histidine kinase
MKSLRHTALVWLAALLGATGTVSAAASYFLVQAETNEFLDGQLRQIAYFVGDTPLGPLRPAPDDPLYDPEDDFLVQIWDSSGTSVRASDPTVIIPRRSVTGFSDETTSDERWRTFAYVVPGHTVQISQRMAVREELAADAALRSAVPIAVLIPLSWLLLGFVINRVMRRLNRVTAIVTARETESREPIPLKDVPSEVAPLVRAMNNLLERLRENLERQRSFVSDAAHELRTPLAALHLQIGNLRRVARGRQLLSRLTDLEDGARRASNLVAKLLRLARYDANLPCSPKDEVDIDDVIAHCLEELSPVATQDGIAIEIQAEASLRVWGRAVDLRILLSNLLDNAVRYTPTGGRVVVRSSTNADGCGIVEICDTGPGIPAYLHERVFERFFRTGSPEIEGTGLGLSIARSIAERHAISISLENGSGGAGLMVRLCMPPSVLVDTPSRVLPRGPGLQSQTERGLDTT